MNWVLDALIRSLFFLHQTDKLLRSELSRVIMVFMQLLEVNIVVSSAYKMDEVLVRQSLRYTRNKRGPRSEP